MGVSKESKSKGATAEVTGPRARLEKARADLAAIEAERAEAQRRVDALDVQRKAQLHDGAEYARLSGERGVAKADVLRLDLLAQQKQLALTKFEAEVGLEALDEAVAQAAEAAAEVNRRAGEYADVVVALHAARETVMVDAAGKYSDAVARVKELAERLDIQPPEVAPGHAYVFVQRAFREREGVPMATPNKLPIAGLLARLEDSDLLSVLCDVYDLPRIEALDVDFPPAQQVAVLLSPGGVEAWKARRNEHYEKESARIARLRKDEALRERAVKQLRAESKSLDQPIFERDVRARMKQLERSVGR